MYFKVLVLAVIGIIGSTQGQGTTFIGEKYLRDYKKTWSSAYLPDRYKVGPFSPCGKAIKKFNDAITSSLPTDAWALTMVDSWGKSSDGFFYGSPRVLGAYDQCLRLSSSDNIIRGKYCSIWKPSIWTRQNGQSIGHPIQWRGQSMGQLMKGFSDDYLQNGRHQSGWIGLHKGKKNHTVGASNNTQVNGSVKIGNIHLNHPDGYVKYGTCIPHECTALQLQTSLLVSSIPEENPIVFKCHEQDWDIVLDDVDISFISFCSVIGILMLAGTAAHGYILYTKQEHLAKGPFKFILPFAVSMNLKKIFTINPQPAPGTISCLNGMRVMSMCWVIWGHQNLFTLSTSANNKNLYMVDTFLSQILINADLSVDSFFFMSGLLVCYGVFREMNKTGRLNIIMYYVHRIIRLTPPIAMAVWWFSTLNRFTVRGPITSFFPTPPNWLASYCRDVGWKDIAYVSNIAFKNNQSIPEGCLGQCWYTSVDTQLYALAPLLLLPLYYYKTIGRAWVYVVTLAAVAMRGFITWNQRNIEVGVDNPWMYDNYFPTWVRADSWLIGIWTGYYIANMGKKKLQLKQWQVVVGWTVAVVFGLMVQFYQYHTPATGTGNIMYEMVHRTIWALCLAWITIACYFGYGGIVNDFLSHPSWQPFSRLTYTMYLVAQEFTYSYVNASRTLFYFTNINKIIETCGILFICTTFALFITLTVEAPILGLEKLLLKRPGRTGQEAADTKASAPLMPINQVSAPIGGKSLPPGYMRHAEKFGGSRKDYPVTGHENVAFESSDKDHLPLKDMSGKHSEAMSAQLEHHQQASADSLQPSSRGEVVISDSQSSDLECEAVPVEISETGQSQAFRSTQVTVDVEPHSTDASS